MAKQNNKQTSEESETARANKNNANNIRNAADIAIASKNPYAMAAGGAVKAADKLTGGKASEALGKALTHANSSMPGGNLRQKALNNINESGLGDKVGKAVSMKNQMAGKNGTSKANEDSKPNNTEKSNKNNNQNNIPTNNANTSGGEQNSSPSSSTPRAPFRDSFFDKHKNDNAKDDSAKSKSSGIFSGMGTITKVIIISYFLGILGIILFIILILSIVNSNISNYDDAFGISQEMGEETGNYIHGGSTEQNDFYKRINNVKLSYQAEGKSIDGLKIVAVYTILKKNGANVSYDKFGESEIKEIADAMFDESNTYNEETFKNNLINNIFPKYLPESTKSERKNMADDVFDYIDNYYSLIGKEKNSDSVCSSTGSCSYNIKGYYINGKGNVKEDIQISNLYVRLMQCGTGNGHNYGGTFGQPLEGEELVPFEKYVLGVAYQEIGPSSPKEAIKAQMIAARSFILARHADMGGWRTLKEESDGKWVLQVAACTQDQVYCDPDKGCSGTDGQWGQVYSGLGHGSFQRAAMAKDSPLRTYANETAGEVLVNNQGYIVYTDYGSTIQNKFISLAKSGLDYKQILLQVYGGQKHNASSIQKNSCGGSSCVNAASGDYANWKQYQGSWINVQVGNSGRTIKDIGCLVTSVSMQIARSGVQTNISNFNPGTFVEYLNSHGGFASGGNFVWSAATSAAPSFKFVGKASLSGLSKDQKLNKIKEVVNQSEVYAVAEVKGNTGQHWVAIDRVEGNKVYMMDPGSTATDMWAQYPWSNTSEIAYYRVG